MRELPEEIAAHRERRRRAPRLDSPVPLFIQMPSSSGRSHTVDLSLTGVRLVIYGDVPQDEDIQVTLNLGPEANLTVRGRKVWIQKNGQASYMGVEFVNTGVGGRAALARWLSSHAPEPIPLPAPRWATPLAWRIGPCGGPAGAPPPPG